MVDTRDFIYPAFYRGRGDMKKTPKTVREIYQNIDRYLQSMHMKKEYPHYVLVTKEQYHQLKMHHNNSGVPDYRGLKIQVERT